MNKLLIQVLKVYIITVIALQTITNYNNYSYRSKIKNINFLFSMKRKDTSVLIN